jgi:hypothetical protein
MALIPPSPVNDVHGLSGDQPARIRAFLQGAVYTWCKHRGGDWFAARDLVGGDDFDWQGTPLIALYEKYAAHGRADAVERAGIDLGWLLKAVLADDRRSFEHGRGGMVKVYRWVRASAGGDAPDAEPGAAPGPAT